MKYSSILQRFEAIPKSKSNPTFLDICQMGGDRFEERCSQILAFFFNPSAPHRLNGLFLNSLLQVIHLSDCSFSYRTTRVITEEMTSDGKYIDITVIADDFVIAIENKIFARLYNPLESYKKHIESSYKDKNKHLFVILSVKRITDQAELKKIKDNDYIVVNYSDFIFTVKRNLGFYACDADQSYLTFLIDFFRTIENRYYCNNMELKHFFYENRDEIKKLIEEFSNFENNILNIQKEQIAYLKGRIQDMTGGNWWTYQAWDLGVFFNEEGNKLGIESYFGDDTIDNPLGKFHIFITVWKKKHFFPYEAALKEAFPNCHIDYDAVGGQRVNMHLPTVDGNDTEAILDALSDCYSKVKNIAERLK